jgi:hypothetical protein
VPNKELRRLSELISAAGSPLQALARQAAQRTDLCGHLRGGLTADLADHLVGGNIRPDGVLVVLTDSPAWATRLRFEGERLLARCQELYPQAAQVKIRVAGPADSASG